MKRQAIQQEKIFANNMTDKRLISKIYKQLISHYIEKTNNPIEKQADDFHRHFFKEDKHLANRPVKNANQQRNTNQNHNEVSSHTGQNGYHLEVYK